MRQLAQRVTAHYNLQALLPGETRAYVTHRCQVAGAETPLFSTFALHWVHWLTGGVPRLINILCDRALLARMRATRYGSASAPYAPRPGKWSPAFVRDRAGSLQRFCLRRHWWPVPAHSVSGS